MSIHSDYLKVLDLEIEENERHLEGVRTQIKTLTEEESRLEGAITETRRLRQFVAIKAGVDSASGNADGASERTPSVSDNETTSPVQRSHAEALVDVLKQSDRSLRMKELIDAVVASGHSLPASEHQQYHALYSALHRRRDLFSKNDRSEWSLKITSSDQSDSVPDDPQHGASINGSSPMPESPTYAQAAAAVIKEYGRPVRTSEIADWMIKKGYKNLERRRFIRNTIYNCLERSSDFLKDDQGRWLLASRPARSRSIDVS